MIKNDHKYTELKEWDYNIYGNLRNKIIYRIDIVSNSISFNFDKRIRIYWLYILIEEGVNLLIACYYLTFEEKFRYTFTLMVLGDEIKSKQNLWKYNKLSLHC